MVKISQAIFKTEVFIEKITIFVDYLLIFEIRNGQIVKNLFLKK